MQKYSFIPFYSILCFLGLLAASFLQYAQILMANRFVLEGAPENQNYYLHLEQQRLLKLMVYVMSEFQVGHNHLNLAQLMEDSLNCLALSHVSIW